MATYLVDGSEIDAIIEGIGLILSVVVHNRLDIRVVERNGLEFAIDGLAIPCSHANTNHSENGAVYLSSMEAGCVTLFTKQRGCSSSQKSGKRMQWYGKILPLSRTEY